MRSFPNRVLIHGDIPTRRIRRGVLGQLASGTSLIEDFNIDSFTFDQTDLLFNANRLRLHDLVGSDGLYRISLQILIEYGDGSVLPLEMAPGESCHIQLEFKKRK